MTSLKCSYRHCFTRNRHGSWMIAVVLACTGLMSATPAHAQPSLIRVPGIIRDDCG